MSVDEGFAAVERMAGVEELRPGGAAFSGEIAVPDV